MKREREHSGAFHGKFTDTVAASCRYGECAEKIWEDWDVIWEDSESDYQGHASFLAKKGNEYCFYEWWYGSCSGCDSWEAAEATNDQIVQEMRDTAMWFKNKKHLKGWLDMLEGNPVSNPTSGGLAGMIDVLGGGIFGRINAIRSELGMKPLSREDIVKRATTSLMPVKKVPEGT